MQKILRFNFSDVDGNGSDVDIFVLTNEISNDVRNEIEDAISSYIDEVEDWQYEELVNDVLKSFNLEYEIITPIEYHI